MRRPSVPIRSRVSLAAAILAWPLASAAQPLPPSSPATPPAVAQGVGPATAATSLAASYVLGPGDELTIHAVDVPEVSDRAMRIDPDGDLRLPMIGRLHAAGQSVEQFENELKTRFSVFLKSPDITVNVTSSRSQTVSVIGAVVNPGVKPLETERTLIDVLSAAGGLTMDAGTTVRVTRKMDQGRIPLPEAIDDSTGAYSTVDLDAKALLSAQLPEKNIVILPNDVIAVPRADVVF